MIEILGLIALLVVSFVVLTDLFLTELIDVE